MTNQIMGLDGMHWFMGVVECANDPEKLGRMKVRVLGDHTQDKLEIPTDDLPWAMPMMPITSASMSGIGDSPVGIVKGSWVVGFYRDGLDKQQPIIIGSLGGLPLDEANGEVGFNDPGECFPSSDKLGEPDTNRLARGISGKHSAEHLSVTTRRSAAMKNIASAATTWDEPDTPYAAQYPYNKVYEGPHNPSCDGCEWGHIEEWDSTPGAERYFRQHKTSQNFLEIHPDGDEVRKIYGNGFEIDLGSKHLYVEGDYKVTIEGNKEEYIKGDLWQVIEGNYNQTVHMNKVTNVFMNLSETAYMKNIRRAVGGMFDVCEGDIMRKSNKNITDVAGYTWTAISPLESTVGIGPVIPSVILPIVPVPMVSDAWPEVGLSCSSENSGKGTAIHLTYPVILPIIHFEEIATITQLKVVPTKIYEDASEVHVFNKTFFTGETHHNSDVFVSGDVNVGANLYALFPAAIDPEGNHPYLVPAPGTAPDPAEITLPVIRTDEVIVIPDVVISHSKDTTPLAPGDIHNC